MSFTGKSPANTYKDIIYVDNNNSGVSSSTKALKTGEGSSTLASISDRSIILQAGTDNTKVLDVKNASGTTLLYVDSTNSQVRALGYHVNTQYACFGVASDISANYAANTHHPIPFAGNNQSPTNQDNITFGTSTEPATTFTTADGAGTDASQLVPGMWYVHDNITIDEVISLEGATSATGDTTRMHMYSYTFTSGSTSALTSGTLLAHNSDVTNAGSEQAYKSNWIVDSANVASGKVILAFFRSDSVNSDYSVNITVKYHLR